MDFRFKEETFFFSKRFTNTIQIELASYTSEFYTLEQILPFFHFFTIKLGHFIENVFFSYYTNTQA